MGDIKLSISIKEENNILFKRCVRKLLDSTFIVGDKDEKLYSFISRESNRQDISDYLRMIGFDVFVDGKPLAFKRAKAKELLALLIDRRGNVLTAKEAICLLYEDDDENDHVKLNYFRTLVHDIRHTLSEAGVPEILVRSRNTLAIRADLIDCDSYRFLQGDPVAINSYRHDYMPNYSWAEYSVSMFEKNT